MVRDDPRLQETLRGHGHYYTKQRNDYIKQKMKEWWAYVRGESSSRVGPLFGKGLREKGWEPRKNDDDDLRLDRSEFSSLNGLFRNGLSWADVGNSIKGTTGSMLHLLNKGVQHHVAPTRPRIIRMHQVETG